MTTFARKLSAEEVVLLKELAASDDVVVRRRAGSILMSTEGKVTRQVAEELGISERSVRNAVRAFNTSGIDSVSRRHPPGRARLLSDVTSEVLMEIMSRSPSDFGMDGCNWSLTSLSSVLNRLGICKEISSHTLRRELVRRGIDWSEVKLDIALSTTCAGVSMDTRDAESQQNTCQLEPSHDHGHSIKRGLYADMLLTSEEGARYDEVMNGLREDFSVTSNVDEMHLQLAAVCYLKLAKAHLAEDWEKAEHMDRMLKGHLTELKTAKKKQEARATKSSGDSPAEWATELLERLAAAEESDGTLDKGDVSTSEMSVDEIRSLMQESYEQWKEQRRS